MAIRPLGGKAQGNATDRTLRSWPDASSLRPDAARLLHVPVARGHPFRGEHARRRASRPAAAVSGRQLVESRHFHRAGRSRVGRLHRLHRSDARNAPRFRRRRVARQRADLRLSVRGRRRRAYAARPSSFSTPTRATASTTRRTRAFPSTRFPTRRSPRRIGSRAASRATSICAAAAIAIC